MEGTRASCIALRHKFWTSLRNRTSERIFQKTFPKSGGKYGNHAGVYRVVSPARVLNPHSLEKKACSTLSVAFKLISIFEVEKTDLWVSKSSFFHSGERVVLIV